MESDNFPVGNESFAWGSGQPRDFSLECPRGADWVQVAVR
ncbi:MAG: hypothetical protein QOF89_4864 [Acidobacteriota bacterium]|nr:hypothetical protein [Acidobacteriota bacterium]